MAFASASSSAILEAASSPAWITTPAVFSGASETEVTRCVGATSASDRPRSASESCSSGLDLAAMMPFNVGYRGSAALPVTVTSAGSGLVTTS